MSNAAAPTLSFSRQGRSRQNTWFVAENGVLNWTIVVKNVHAFLNFENVKEAFLALGDDAPSFDGWVCLKHGTNEVLGFGATREEAAQNGLSA